MADAKDFKEFRFKKMFRGTRRQTFRRTRRPDVKYLEEGGMSKICWKKMKKYLQVQNTYILFNSIDNFNINEYVKYGRFSSFFFQGFPQSYPVIDTFLTVRKTPIPADFSQLFEDSKK